MFERFVNYLENHFLSEQARRAILIRTRQITWTKQDANIQDTPQCCGLHTFPVVVNDYLNSVFESCVVRAVGMPTVNICTNKST